MEYKYDIKEWKKLKISVLFGWLILSLVPILSIAVWLIESMKYPLGEYLYIASICALIILCLRYSLIKPIQLAGAALAGIFTVSIIELISRGRISEQSFLISGFLILVMLLFVLVRSMLLSVFYLLRESFYYYKYK